MPYPTPPAINTSYTAEEQSIGNGTLPGQELDVDFASLTSAIEDTIDFLKGITRSDGKLANGIVTEDSLAASIRIGFDAPAPWATPALYTTRSTVFQGFGFYLCTIAHTSSVFATDLASGRWQLLANLTPPGGSLINTNNLSDVSDKAAARANLLLGTAATVNSGTGASDIRVNSQNDARFQLLGAPLDDDLAAIAALVSTGLIARTGAGTVATRTITSTDSSVVITNPGGVAGDINLAAVRDRILLDTKTASASATLDFTAFNNSLYRAYEFELDGIKPSVSGAILRTRNSNNGGSSYGAGAGAYVWSYNGNASDGSTFNGNSPGDTGTTIAPLVGNSGSHYGVYGSLKLLAAPGAVETLTQSAFVYRTSTSLLTQIRGGGGQIIANDTNALRFLFDSGNITSGVIRMYGVI